MNRYYTPRHGRFERYDVPREADDLECPDRQVGDVELPPPVPVGGRPRLRVMVIVPTLAVRPQADEDVVLAVLVRVVVAVAPHVRHGIDRPGDVPDEYRPQKDAPDEQAQARLHAGHHFPAS